METKSKKVVILGAGFAGVRTALDLVRSGKDIELVLVNKSPFHEFHADLYEVATTHLEENIKPVSRLTYQHLKGSAAVPLEEIFKDKKIKLIIDTVLSLDLKNKKIRLSKNEEILFDVLVLALGSETNYFGITNLEKYALPLKNVDDALNVRNQIDELFATKKGGEGISIVVGGGGFSGCEFAGSLVGYLKSLEKIHSHKNYAVKLSVVEACPVLINGVDRAVQKATKKRLETQGIDLYLGRKITKVTQNMVYADPDFSLRYDLLVWTAGIKSNSLVEQLTGLHKEKTCLVVDKTLRLISFKDVFAIGDIAYCYDEEKSCPVPATAQNAIAQGAHTAKNILRLLEEKDLHLFHPKMPKFIVPLGGKFAITQFGGLLLEGIEAWALKRGAALRYFSSILPSRRAVKVWSEANKFFLENDR